MPIVDFFIDKSKQENVENVNLTSSNDIGDVLSEGLDWSGPRNILHNCLINLETKVKEISDLANTTKEIQIKCARKQ